MIIKPRPAAAFWQPRAGNLGAYAKGQDQALWAVGGGGFQKKSKQWWLSLHYWATICTIKIVKSQVPYWHLIFWYLGLPCICLYVGVGLCANWHVVFHPAQSLESRICILHASAPTDYGGVRTPTISGHNSAKSFTIRTSYRRFEIRHWWRVWRSWGFGARNHSTGQLWSR
jgi:hypothetical protein